MSTIQIPKIGVIGNYSEGTSRIDGQTLRTRLVIEEVKRRIGEDNVRAVDTSKASKKPGAAAVELMACVFASSHVVAMPGAKGVKILLPVLAASAKLLGKRLHYIVIGGWLASYAEESWLLRRALKLCTTVHVQANRMRIDLLNLGLAERQVFYLPNFKRFDKNIKPKIDTGDPLRLVFFSRVIAEKGIEEAVEATKLFVEEAGGGATLTVYGPVLEDHREWFDKILAQNEDWLKYGGIISGSAQACLRDYDVSLFPTYYSGEGFPGVIVDCYSAGIPVITTDWAYNSEIVSHRETGFLVRVRDPKQIADKIALLSKNRILLDQMKNNAAGKAHEFHCDVVVDRLLADMDVAGDRHR